MLCQVAVAEQRERKLSPGMATSGRDNDDNNNINNDNRNQMECLGTLK